MERYIRQIGMPQIGLDGQSRLAKASALVIGAGGLGSALLFCLAGAGVGHIGIADFDTIAESNLNRQFLHTTDGIGKDKLDSALMRLKAYNPSLQYELHHCKLDDDNAEALFADYDIVLMAVDNMPARMAANRTCVKQGKPLVNGGVNGMYGSVQIVEAGKSACLACLYGKNPKLSTATSFAPVVSTISSLMAQGALVMLLGLPNPLPDTLLYFDGEHMTFERLSISRDPLCHVCG
ncbi:MAG: HesA/MoeB/ThiF family protein [Oscillospiraceae bacterium]|nr:HesA/MoeB/ThiF family protein [Oscillospiraceae bacterium]